MKLKTLLKVTIATKIDVTVEVEQGKVFDYYIDYLSNNEVKDGYLCRWCRSKVDLPKEVLNREVTYVHTNKEGALVIDCYLKGE